MRQLKFHQAILEGTDICMREDENVYLMGLGVPDPKGIFGTTLGLEEKYGSERVLDMPTSENGMTGVAIGSALLGKRPIMTHQRVDFALLSVEQIVNQAAKWHYMFGGKASVPLVIRLIVGRGWGQGPQHSQSLHSWFAHIPGLVVLSPATPYDAKGLLISAVEDNNPVVYFEHRWLHNINGEVPEGRYHVPLGKARVAKAGRDVTIVTSSYMTLEALRAQEILEKEGVSAEVIDLRSIRPLDEETILESVRKTGRLIAADLSWQMCGLSSEITALACEQVFSSLKCAPIRISLPDVPTPTSHALSKHFYPRAVHLVAAAEKLMGRQPRSTETDEDSKKLDIPDPSFKGPF